MLIILLTLILAISINAQPAPAPVVTPPTPPTTPAPVLRFSLNGYDCDPPNSADPPLATAICSDPNQILTKQLGEPVECNENFSCCLCKQIICNGCSGIVANGDSSAIGSGDIQIAGDPNAPAYVDCNGDLSCQETRISGTGVKSIQCTGDGSCQGAVITVTCIPTGCPVLCVGDNSCAGPGPYVTGLPFQSIFTITNSHGLYCAHDACRNGIFNLDTNQGGILSCGAEAACQFSTISVTNIEAMRCGAELSCSSTMVTVTNPRNGFYLHCGAFQTCKDLTLNVVITDPSITTLGEFSCGGIGACTGMVVTITAPPTSPVTIQLIDCTGNSCTGALYNLVNARPLQCLGCPFNLFDPFWTPPLNAGILKSQIDKLECVGAANCFHEVYSVINPNDGFELICGSQSSCQGATLTLFYLPQQTATNFKGVKCGAPMSCQDLTLDIINDGPVPIFAEKIECTAPKSCHGAIFTTTFGTGAPVYYLEVICAMDACLGCTIDGVPCDQYVYTPPPPV